MGYENENTIPRLRVMPALWERRVTAREMQAIDQKCLEEYGIPSLILMEHAGRGVAELVAREIDEKGNKVVVVAGKGNNGGDGLVAARHLYNRGFEVTVLLFADPQNLREDPKRNLQILERMKVPLVVFGSDPDYRDVEEYLVRADMAIDALFGVGLREDLREPYFSLVELMNRACESVVAVDLPSGLEADSGRVLGVCVRAAITATLGLPKQGLFIGEGPEYAGDVWVLDIGIPRPLLVPEAQ